MPQVFFHILFSRRQFIFGRAADRRIIHIRHPRADQRRKSLFQLIHIRFCLGEEAQDIIDCNVRLLPFQFNQTCQCRVLFLSFT